MKNVSRPEKGPAQRPGPPFDQSHSHGTEQLGISFVKYFWELNSLAIGFWLLELLNGCASPHSLAEPRERSSVERSKLFRGPTRH